MSELKSTGKPFDISKWDVWQAWERVKVNKGGPGVDGVTIEDFEADLRNNLYKIWNRMSSGTYFPPPVKAVGIPKQHSGGVRILGVPCVADRVAQTVVAAYLEERVEPIFHPDSYGYRRGKSALDAVERCRRRCWERDWVIEFDVQGFFDSVRHDLIVKAVAVHVDVPWVLLYVKRWLTAPIQQLDGTLAERDRGTPQGSSVSPVLANLFLHYALDMWLVREFPTVQFERYADDGVLHCVTGRQARQVLVALRERMEEVGLALHPAKTTIVYCRDGRRCRTYDDTAFTFLGFTFGQRTVRCRDGTLCMSFLPAISKDALNRISREVRLWGLHRRTGSTFAHLAKTINVIVAGWMRYYGAFYRSMLYPLLGRINAYLVKWIQKKYRRLKTVKKARRAYQGAVHAYPGLFAHWQWVPSAWRTR